jgi:hypothetical protein
MTVPEPVAERAWRVLEDVRKREANRIPHGRGYEFETLFEFVGAEEYAKNWIIKRAIAWGETSAWVGPPGSLKSALMASLAISAAFNRPWFGLMSKGEGVGVVYFALERPDLVRRRLEAQMRRDGLSCDSHETSPIVVVPCTVDLADQNAVAKIVTTVRNIEAFAGMIVGVLIFDTFAKLIAAGGGDEDKARDQGKVLANLERVKDALGRPHVALVGHTGKDETRGARGSNAILGDVDMMVTISGDDVKTATVTKANDAPEGPLFSFKSEVFTFGTDEDGDPITVNIVSNEAVEPPKPGTREERLTKNQTTMFGIVHDAGTAGLTTERWNELARAAGLGISRRADLHDIRQQLLSKGLVQTFNDIWKVNHS